MSLILLAVVVVLMICGVVAVDKSPIPPPANWVIQIVIIVIGAAFILLKMGWLRA